MRVASIPVLEQGLPADLQGEMALDESFDQAARMAPRHASLHHMSIDPQLQNQRRLRAQQTMPDKRPSFLPNISMIQLADEYDLNRSSSMATHQQGQSPTQAEVTYSNAAVSQPQHHQYSQVKTRNQGLMSYGAGTGGPSRSLLGSKLHGAYKNASASKRQSRGNANASNLGAVEFDQQSDGNALYGS